jgi:hypothetical protein
MAQIVDRIELFALRMRRAWRYWRLLGYSWRLAWAKAGWSLGR